MSARASVMKLFDKNYNAQFLLGLSKATEEALSEIEESVIQEDNRVLGRDADCAFSSFSTCSESAACLLIRLAAKVLGPRGDVKNGCREDWLAFCSLRGKKSKFTSSRGNRFNNLFENASAVIHHYDDVLSFLVHYCPHSNLKLKSIIADLKDSRIINIIAAMSLFHCFFTAPYWNLMNSSVSYGQFPRYVTEMKNVLESWSDPLFHLCLRIFFLIVETSKTLLQPSLQLTRPKFCQLFRKFRANALKSFSDSWLIF